MVAQLPKTTASPIVYPDDDGLPMSDNTLQFEWIMTFYYNLDWLFADSPEVFVAGNLLWYPIEGQVKTRQAPDVMVVFGARKGYRGSYKQWQEKNIAPQVVFEILSPGNTQTEMSKKLLFYNFHGVEEYYIYDPHKNELSGLIRPEQSEILETGAPYLQVIEEMQGWTSPRVGIRFELSEETLQVYRPDGEPFATYLEAQRQLEEVRQRAEQAEIALAQERQKAQLLAEKLRQMGVNPDEL
ncbi:Uma2 family endonuclease [Oscillatoria sp. FACHB-1406]|uniref:Uma2 family endonuclease n=1 Tax=Oscillatoria sp. FACHB-1406 TaxID=2692846 RepID=UPI0016821414|nr:Uma2 family endonuclease [Oscillatoria sp. FACHB-1406]MBD2578160.1 Uma2 family endonuclease [Oscillatoria sp. FACHB-1406]